MLCELPSHSNADASISLPSTIVSRDLRPCPEGIETLVYCDPGMNQSLIDLTNFQNYKPPIRNHACAPIGDLVSLDDRRFRLSDYIGRYPFSSSFIFLPFSCYSLALSERHGAYTAHYYIEGGLYRSRPLGRTRCSSHAFCFIQCWSHEPAKLSSPGR